MPERNEIDWKNAYRALQEQHDMKVYTLFLFNQFIEKHGLKGEFDEWMTEKMVDFRSEK